MAKLSKKDVLRLAALAKLELSPDEIDDYREELSKILDYVEKLQQVNVDGLKPSYQVTGLRNATREDEEIDYGVSQTELLKNVPETENNQIKVKRVL